jgi:hypothetical protein
MTKTIALFGAAGKIGTRIANRLQETENYHILYVEAGEAGEARLRERGLMPTSQADAIAQAEVVILAVPDVILGKVAHHVVPGLKSGTLVICLDPAAPYADQLPPRDDVAYFVVHPCHPPVVNDEIDLEAKMDFYGGVKAKQALVCALIQGTDDDYALGEQIVRVIFAPVMRTHRITLEQMVILEPAMAETVVLTCMFIIKEAMEEAVQRGVPQEAALDFLLGHVNVNLGIQYGYLPDTQFSDAALLMVEKAKQQLIKSNWRQVFEWENIDQQVAAILSGK